MRLRDHSEAEWRLRTIEQSLPQFESKSLEGGAAPVIQSFDAHDAMPSERSIQADMEVAPWRKGVLETLRERRVAAALPCEAAVEIRDEVFLARRADVRAGRKAEKVLGFDAVMVVSVGVLMTGRLFAGMLAAMGVSLPGRGRV
jgi:hypothetical protein